MVPSVPHVSVPFAVDLLPNVHVLLHLQVLSLAQNLLPGHRCEMLSRSVSQLDPFCCLPIKYN